MITLLIIVVYIGTIFLGRYLDIKVSIHINQVHYKSHLMYGFWFIPAINILYPLLNYIEHEISCRKHDIKHNKFINWFFVGVNYKAKHEKIFNKEFDDYMRTKDEIERDLTMPKK